MKFNIILLIFTILCGWSCNKEKSSSNSQITPNDFLSDRKYETLEVEIVYVNGFEPSSTALGNLETFLNEILKKPGGISITTKSINSPGKDQFSINDLKKVEETHRTKYADGDKLAAYFFFADAGYSEDQGNSKVLGVAYAPTSMTIFEKTIQEFSGGLGEPSTSSLETTVINHEFGHILGLVNNGTPIQSAHQDVAHGKHCDIESCLMYYTAETSDIVGNILGSGIPQLDSQCLADLKANGGK